MSAVTNVTMSTVRVAYWLNYSGAIIIIGSYVAASFQHDALSWLRALKYEDSKNFKTRSVNLMLDKHAAMWRALFDFDIVANNLHEQGRNLPQPHCTHTHTHHHRQRCESICHANSKPHSHTHRHRHIFIVAHSHFHALSLSPSYLPSAPVGNGISSPPSRRQVIVGVGEPVAAHFRVTFEPSRMTMSVLVG